MTACRDISQLLSQSQDRQLTQQERLEVKRHLLTCKKCAAFQQQLQTLRGIARSYGAAGDPAAGVAEPGLSGGAKYRIAQALGTGPAAAPARPQRRASTTRQPVAAPPAPPAAEPAIGSAAIQTYIFCDGNFIGSEVSTGTRIEIGRDPAADVVLQDDQVSRRHAAVTLFRNQLYVEDLRSSNGTLVAGQPISERVVIGQRDDVTIGRHTLKFKVMRPGDEREAPLPGDLGEVAATNPLEGAPLQHDPTEISAPLDQVVMTDPEELEPRGGPTDIDHPSYDDLAKAEGRDVDIDAMQRALGDSPLDRAPDLIAEALAQPPADELEPEPEPEPVPVPAPRRRAAPVREQTEDLPAPRGWAADDEIEPPAPHHPLAADFDADDDEEEDDEPAADFSLFRSYLTESSGDERQRGRPALLLIQYRDDAIWELSSLRRGEAHVLNRDLPRATARELGVPRNYRLARLRMDGAAEIAVVHGVKGKVRQGGSTRTIDEVTDWRGERGVLRLQAGDVATLQMGRDNYLVRFGYPPGQLLQVPPGLLNNAEQRRELRRGAFSGATAVGMHFMVLLGLYIQSLLLPSPSVQQLAEDRFAEVDTKMLELQKPPEPVKEEPPAKEEPAVEEKAPEPDPKQKDLPVRSKIVSKEAKKEAPGILAALGKIPKMSGPAGGQTLVAAVSNLDAVKVPGGGGASYKVSGLIGKGPTNRIQLGGSGGGVSTKGLASILREGGGGPGTLSKLQGGSVRGRLVKVSRGSKTRGGGYLDRAEIQKVVNKGIGQIQFCYEKELLKNQSLSGKVVFEWTIGPSGRVTIVKTVTSSMNSPGAVQCMINAIKGWQFPQPRGGEVIVTYPFIFNAMGF